MRIDYLGLEAFVRIAEHGSFQRAADALHLSQTALSHRLRKLEADLGTALLIRSSREVSLTPAGQELLPDAQRLLKELADRYAAVRGRGRNEARRVTFACVPTIAHAWMPPILTAFAAEHPGAAVSLFDIPVAHIADKVQSGEAEFGVTIVSAHLPDLRVQELFQEPYVLLVPQAHPLAALPAVGRADLHGVTVARISTQSKNRQLVDDALGDARDAMHWRFEVQNAAMAIRLVAHGAAATILPQCVAEFVPQGVAVRPFADIRPSRSVGLVRRRGVPVSELAAALIRAVEAGLARHAGLSAGLPHPLPLD